MKFSLFLHVERYDESVSHRQHYEDLLELCDLAEAGGIDKVWVGEHHAMEYTATPSPLQILASVAARTSRIRLVRAATEARICSGLGVAVYSMAWCSPTQTLSIPPASARSHNSSRSS